MRPAGIGAAAFFFREMPRPPPARGAAAPKGRPAEARRAARLAALIGLGGKGARLAERLAAEGVKGRAGLLRRLADLPAEARANVVFRPERAFRDGAALAAEVVRRLRFGGRRRPEVIPVGSVRRGAARANDLDFLVVAPGAALDPGFLGAARLARGRPGDRLVLAAAYAQGPRRRGVILCQGARAFRADLFLATPAERPFALFHFTGPAAYNVRTRAAARRRGLRLSQYGLAVAATGRRAPGAAGVRTEADLARLLGVRVRAPGARGGGLSAPG